MRARRRILLATGAAFLALLALFLYWNAYSVAVDRASEAVAAAAREDFGLLRSLFGRDIPSDELTTIARSARGLGSEPLQYDAHLSHIGIVGRQPVVVVRVDSHDWTRPPDMRDLGVRKAFLVTMAPGTTGLSQPALVDWQVSAISPTSP